MRNDLVGLERLVALVKVGLDMVGALDVGDEKLLGGSLGQNTTAEVSIMSLSEKTSPYRTLG